jgi:hypothetical protein
MLDGPSETVVKDPVPMARAPASGLAMRYGRRLSAA